VNPRALEMGKEALSPHAAAECDLLVIDEVGPWELAGEGWSISLEALHGSEVALLPVTRLELVEDVVARLAPGGAPVWNVGLLDGEAMAEKIRASLQDSPRTALHRGKPSVHASAPLKG